MVHSTKSIAVSALICATMGGCGGAGRGDPHVLDEPGRSTAPAGGRGAPAVPRVDPAAISVAPLAVPAKLAIDGEVAEWGDLRPRQRSAEERAKLSVRPVRRDFGVEPKPEDLDKAGPQEENPRDAASRVGLAITADRVVLAGSLAEVARDGVFVGIGSEPPLFPPIGEYTRGGGFDQVICTDNRYDYSEGSRYDTGEPNPPEVIAACKQLLARYAARKATHDKRFARTYRIDASGVRVAGDDGKLVAVEGAKVIWKPAPAGATFEATMPLVALPRFSQAPLAALELFARPAPPDAAAPPLARTAWFRDWFDAPVAFEPLADLRARVFEKPADEAGGSGSYAPPRGLSYQPGDPMHVETLDWADRMTSVNVDVDELYTKRTTIGDVEIGLVDAAWSLAIFKNGKLLDTVYSGGGRRGMVQRNGEAHFFDYRPAEYVMHMGIFVPPSYSVVAIGPDGKHREAVKPLSDDDALFCNHYDDAAVTASKDLDRFGFTTTCNDYTDIWKVEVTWTWNETEKLYVPKLVKTPQKKAPAKKK